MLGGGGAMRGDGTLLLGARDMHPGFGARDFTLHAQDVNLQRWLTRGSAPPSRLTFTATGSVAADSVTKPTGELSVLLAPSLFAGTIIDSGGTKVRFAEGRLIVDSLRLQQPGLLTSGGGSLGWQRPDHGPLSLAFDADSLSVLDSLMTWFAGASSASASTEDKLKGSAQVRMTLDGALDSLSIGGDAHVLGLRWRGWRLPKGEGTIAYQPGPVPQFDVVANIDSLGYGRFGFGAAAARARGTRDSLTWFARSRVGDLGAFLAGGRYARPDGPGTQYAVVDSLAVLVPSGVWFLERPTAVAFGAPFMDGIIDYRGRRLNGEVHLWRSGQQVLNVTAHLPLDLALVPVAQRQLPDTLSVQARADSVDLGVLAAVTTTLQDVEGIFNADLGIGGTWEAPRLRGGLEIGHAAATIPALNVRYTNMNGSLSLRGDTIRVDSITATSERGHAELTGFMRLERLTKPVLALNIATSEFKALDLRGYLALTASGRVALTGPVFGTTLTGRGTVTSGVLHFADLVNKRVVNLDEPWVQDLIDTSLIRTQRLGPEFQSLFFDSLQVRNLQLTMGEDVWLRSNEANIQLSGSVAVNKVRSNYILSGTLQAPRGTYRLIIGPVTREFTVDQGTVRYFGTPDLDAELDIAARHVVHPLPGPGQPPEITVIAHIRGTLKIPKLTLDAEHQDYSQAELISYLISGKPSFELGGGEGPFVRSAAASF